MAQSNYISIAKTDVWKRAQQNSKAKAVGIATVRSPSGSTFLDEFVRFDKG